jgi:glycosyltransferase involved in cell wall biosynthesis
MKILISSFACSPYQGSEPGVGWTAIQQIATQGHLVCVLTHEHSREPIERAIRECLVPANVQFRFVGKFDCWHPNGMLARIQSWVIYRNYCREVLAAAVEWHKEIGFNLCHQVTIASFRQPSELWKLTIPFIWGPLGGAGVIPPAFRSMLSPCARGFEKVRDLSTFFALRSKALLDCIHKTSVLVCANEETSNFIKPFRENRPMFKIPVLSFPPEQVDLFQIQRFSPPDDGTLQIFAGGSLIGSKGLNLALLALALVKRQGVDFHYTIAGCGSELKPLKRLTHKLGLDARVTFHPGYKGDDYVKTLQSNHVFLLPSFRESLGITMIEAVIAGCYPVVADISAPGEIIRRSGGIALKVDTQENLIQAMVDAVMWCSQNKTQLKEMALSVGKNIANDFSSERYRRLIECAYETALEAGKPVKSSRKE